MQKKGTHLINGAFLRCRTKHGNVKKKISIYMSAERRSVEVVWKWVMKMMTGDSNGKDKKRLCALEIAWGHTFDEESYKMPPPHSCYWQMTGPRGICMAPMNMKYQSRSRFVR